MQIKSLKQNLNHNETKQNASTNESGHKLKGTKHQGPQRSEVVLVSREVGFNATSISYRQTWFVNGQRSSSVVSAAASQQNGPGFKQDGMQVKGFCHH